MSGLSWKKWIPRAVDSNKRLWDSGSKRGGEQLSRLDKAGYRIRPGLLAKVVLGNYCVYMGTLLTIIYSADCFGVFDVLII